jgi:2-iminoacetate synthase
MNIFINEKKINSLLEKAKTASDYEAERVIVKALKLKGLTPEETALLLQNNDPSIFEKIKSAAQQIKDMIYGKRLVLFAPLYVTNECVNNCLYCSFRRDNKALIRKTLNLSEIKAEVQAIVNEGHKRLLLVAGEDPRSADINNLEKIIAAVYETKSGRGAIRRLNVNVAPLSVENFKKLKRTGIGTYQLFQETYHRSTYYMVHPKGPKADYKYRLFGMDRAMEAGIDDVGIGVLFGLYDYKFEVLAMLYHALHLEKSFGVGPHTISVPRIEPSIGAPIAHYPPYPVSDHDFKKMVAIIRLAVPYTGMILSTRENAAMRNELISLGISQISAGSRTNPGGYQEKRDDRAAQFSLSDDRSTEAVIMDVMKLGYVPSFCTACYRLGRTGEKFMELAKPGEIHAFCQPNSLLTLKEYVEDYAKDGSRGAGEKVIREELDKIKDPKIRHLTAERLQAIEAGKRDLYL